MKFSQLPKAYQDLEKDFPLEAFTSTDEVDVTPVSDDIFQRFVWDLTPQSKRKGDQTFWRRCYEAQTVDELPPIPDTEVSPAQSYVPPADSVQLFKINEIIEVSNDGKNWVKAFYNYTTPSGKYNVFLVAASGNPSLFKLARKIENAAPPKPPTPKFSVGEPVEVSNNGTYWYPAMYVQHEGKCHSVRLTHDDVNYGSPLVYDFCRPRFAEGEWIEVSNDGKTWGNIRYRGHKPNGRLLDLCVGNTYRFCRKAASTQSVETPDLVPHIEPGTEVYVRDFGSERWSTETYFFIGYARIGDPVCEGHDGKMSSWEAVISAREIDRQTIKSLAAKHGFDLTKI